MSAVPSVTAPPPQMFKPLNNFIMLLFRLGLGTMLKDSPNTGCIMMLAHTGRKSGVKRYTPVNYALIGGDVYCIAGYGHIAQWYRNVQADPQVEIWLGNQCWSGQAETINDVDKAAGPIRQVLINSAFAGRMWLQQDPANVPEATLHEVALKYPLVRIRLSAGGPPCKPGEPRPGDLAWLRGVIIAALTALILVIVLGGRRQMRHK